MVFTKKNSVLTSLLLTLLLLLSLIAPSITSAQEPPPTQKINYLALGDSLAAGQTPTKQLGIGYTDLLAENMREIGFLNSFSKQYATSGYTSTHLLQDIQNDVKKGENDTVGIKAHIANANVITINAGANDLLQKMQRTETGVTIDQALVPGIMKQVGTNIGSIIIEVKKLNPTAKFYVMGYYNAFPYLPADQQAQLQQVLTLMNQTIQQVTVTTGATYVPTADAIATDFKTNIPNPMDIHPSVKGYNLIAKEFWKEMLPALTQGHKNSIFVNGQFQTFEQNPVYVNNRTLVHIRSLSVNLGATVEWYKEFNTILITRGPDVVQIKIGSNEATRNGTPIELDSSAQVINNRMMVPIRFVSESLGAKVKWDAPTNNIFLAN